MHQVVAGPAPGLCTLCPIETALGLLAVAVLILANAAFVANEFSLVAVDRGRVSRHARQGRAAAKLTEKLLRRLSYHLSGAQLGITLTSLLLGFIAEPTVPALLEEPLPALIGDEIGSASGREKVVQ